MSYYRRLSDDARRAREQHDDGFGLLRIGLCVVAVLLVLAWWVA